MALHDTRPKYPIYVKVQVVFRKCHISFCFTQQSLVFQINEDFGDSIWYNYNGEFEFSNKKSLETRNSKISKIHNEDCYIDSQTEQL